MNLKKALRKKIGKYRREKKLRKRYDTLLQQAKDFMKLCPCPELTADEIKAIDEYWTRYGIKYYDYSWFRMYYGVTGIKDPGYVSKEVQFTIVQKYYNTKELAKVFRDKNLFDLFLPGAPFPESVVKRMAGYFYDGRHNYISDKEKVIDLIFDAREVILKDTWVTGEAKNVKKYVFSSRDEVAQMLDEWSGRQNFLVQACVRQHSFFSGINESSVNVIRVNTWLHDGNVDILTPVFRAGIPGSTTDICVVDGVKRGKLIGITPDGYLRDTVIDFDGSIEPFETVYPGFDRSRKIPAWDETLDALRTASMKLPFFGIIGWDITVDENGKPVFIEYNINEPGPHGSQLVNGPFFEDKTDEALSFLLDKKNQEKYVPGFMRA